MSKSDHALTTSMCHWSSWSLPELTAKRRHFQLGVLRLCWVVSLTRMPLWFVTVGAERFNRGVGVGVGAMFAVCIECGLALNCNDVKLACFMIMSPVSSQSRNRNRTQNPLPMSVPKRGDTLSLSLSLSLS